MSFNFSFNLKQQNNNKESNLTLSTITASAYGELTEEEAELAKECKETGGIWGSVLEISKNGEDIIECTSNFEIECRGVLLHGDYIQEQIYFIRWEILDCKARGIKNCCNPNLQGLYVEGIKPRN